jgi:hypothetical protein
VRKQLIVYDRETDLMPLLQLFSKQTCEYGPTSGGSGGATVLSYDFERIEAELANTLLAGKSPIACVIRHFPYAGEVKGDVMTSLNMRVSQLPLEQTLLDQLWAEVDTQHRLSGLILQLEECIAFLVSVGGDAKSTITIDGSTKLQTYVLDALLVEPAAWSAVCTPVIEQHVRLCHLDTMLTFLHNKMNGDPADATLQVFRSDLDAAASAGLKAAFTSMNSDMQMWVLGNLRKLLVDHCCSQDSHMYGQQESLSLMFALDLVFEEDPPDELYTILPDSVLVSHAYQVYRILEEL